MISPLDEMLDAVEWKGLDEPDQLHTSDVFATHEGVLTIGALTLRCYTLNTGGRVFDADDLAAVLLDHGGNQ